MSETKDSRSDDSQKPQHWQDELPLLSDDDPEPPPAPEPEREDIPTWLRPMDAARPRTHESAGEQPVAPGFGMREVPIEERFDVPPTVEHDSETDEGEQVEVEDRSAEPGPAEPVVASEALAAEHVGDSEPAPEVEPELEPASGIELDPEPSSEPELEHGLQPEPAPEPEPAFEPEAAPDTPDAETDDAGAAEDEGPAAWPQDDPDFRPFAAVAAAQAESEHTGDEAPKTEELDAAALLASGDHLVDRVRPPREKFVSRRAILFGVLGVLALALIAGGVTWFMLASRVTVPDFQREPVGVARVEAARAGLEIVVSERRFSPYEVDQVLEQKPAAGTRVRRGTAISVVVSGGTEEFALPDVTGVGLALARGQLETRGLQIEVVSQPSQDPSGTVLATIPGPNTPVKTGDLIRLTVSTPVSDSGLKSYKLNGRVFVLDPAPPAKGINDVSMEVSRRLRALLEASSAKVVTTRSAVDTGAPDAKRAATARMAAPNAVIGTSVTETGAAGIAVQRSDASSITQLAESQQLQGDIVKALTGSGYPAASGTLANDVVLQATNAASVRVVLGSVTSKKDTAAFRDPKWADGVARAIYQALGQRYGTQ